jgi:integrase
MGVKVREKPKASGIYWVFINHHGRRKSKKIGTDKKLAKEVAEKIKAKLVLGEFDLIVEEKKDGPKFKDYASLWLEDYIKQTKRHTTYQRYKSLLKRYIEPKIGKITIEQIKRSDVRNTLLAIYKKGLSKSTVSTARNVISGTIEYAIEEELLTSNPAAGILKKLGLDARKGRAPVQPMTPDEVDLFLETCLKYERRWYPLFLCAFRTGMRLGELLALEWGDIDWNGKCIHVQRSFRNGIITKTKNSRMRRVDMSDQLTAELRKLLNRRKEEGLKAGKGEPEEIIFHTKGGNTSQNTIRNIWKRLLTKAGLRDQRLHNTRHTNASILLSNGESPVYVKEQLGHSSIQMTVDIYGHLIPNSNREAVNRLDNPRPNAPHPHPPKTENPQPIEIVDNS